jgi:hypothetical protein
VGPNLAWGVVDTKEGAEVAAAASNHRVIMELEHVHAILRKLGAEGPDGFLREEASAARELATAAATAAGPLVQCECVRVHAGARWPLNRPPAAGWANRPSQYLRGSFALVERIDTSNQYEGRQSWTDDGMHELSVRLDDETD